MQGHHLHRALSSLKRAFMVVMVMLNVALLRGLRMDGDGMVKGRRVLCGGIRCCGRDDHSLTHQVLCVSDSLSSRTPDRYNPVSGPWDVFPSLTNANSSIRVHH